MRARGRGTKGTVLSPFVATMWDNYASLLVPLCMLSMRVNLLISESKKKTDLIIERSKMLYGYTPEEKTKENLEWMRVRGYLTTKRNRVGKPGKPSKR